MIKTLISTFPLSIILINAFGHHGGSRLKVIGGKILKSMFSNKKNWNRIIPSNFSFSESFRFGLISSNYLDYEETLSRLLYLRQDKLTDENGYVEDEESIPL